MYDNLCISINVVINYYINHTTWTIKYTNCNTFLCYDL